MNGKAMLFLVVGVVLTAGLFVFFKREVPAPTVAEAPVVPVAAVSLPIQPVLAEPIVTVPPSPTVSAAREFQLTVKGKKLIAGPEVLSVTEGDQVVIVITSDVVEELHLHGYDKSLDLKPNVPGRLAFVADRSGRFEYELEKSRVELGALEVQPK